jgi:hypothetical protein
MLIAAKDETKPQTFFEILILYLGYHPMVKKTCHASDANVHSKKHNEALPKLWE